MPNRLSPFDRDALDARGRALYDHVLAGPRGPRVADAEGVLAGPFDAWVRRPDLGEHLEALGEALRFSGSLAPHLRELAILAVGAHWRAEFEFWAHAHIARRAGVPDDVIDAIATGKSPDFATAEDGAVFEFAKTLVTTGRVPNDQFAGVAAAVGEAGVIELVTLVGYYVGVSFVLNVFDVALPDGVPKRWPADTSQA